MGKWCPPLTLPLLKTNQIQRTAQTVLLFWNLLYEILPEIGVLGLMLRSLRVRVPAASTGPGNQPGLLLPCQLIFLCRLLSILASAFPILQFSSYSTPDA